MAARTLQKTVLLVDDDPQIRTIVALTLRSEGFSTLEAENGVAALVVLRDVVPDLVILDWSMPKMGGLELAERIRQEPRTENIPIVMLTARTFETPAVRPSSALDALLMKPFSPVELLHAVETVERR